MKTCLNCKYYLPKHHFSCSLFQKRTNPKDKRDCFVKDDGNPSKEEISILEKIATFWIRKGSEREDSYNRIMNFLSKRKEDLINN